MRMELRPLPAAPPLLRGPGPHGPGPYGSMVGGWGPLLYRDTGEMVQGVTHLFSERGRRVMRECLHTALT